MLNLEIGTALDVEGMTCLRTRVHLAGHAIYGPYEMLEPGRYQVDFLIKAEAGDRSEHDHICALVDVAGDLGQRQLASDFVFLSQLSEMGLTRIPLEFEVDRATECEYRVHVVGEASLIVADGPRIKRLAPDAHADCAPPAASVPDLLIHDRPAMRSLYGQGALLEITDAGLIAKMRNVAFHASNFDDIRFVDELFTKNAYNFLTSADTCVIDVGMNVGLASLLFAAKTTVKEVHSFEPFPETYERGVANIALNPETSKKIKTNFFGLGDRDEETIFLVSDTGGDSGAQSVRSVEGGKPVKLVVRDAGAALTPLIRSARARNLRVVAKIDCEGAEFAIFGSLARAGLLKDIDALMVEWHRVFNGRTQDELIQPLLDNGFLVIDITPATGNGFFYAMRQNG